MTQAGPPLTTLAHSEQVSDTEISAESLIGHQAARRSESDGLIGILHSKTLSLRRRGFLGNQVNCSYEGSY